MKKYTTLILIGIICVLAAVLAGTLLFLRNQPPQERTLQQVTTVQPLEPDSAVWGLNFPNEYSSFLLTASNNTATKYGGSSKRSYLADDPRLEILYAGSAYAKAFTQARGHANSLIDVRSTARVSATTHATCYSCKSADNPKLWSEMGMPAFDAMLFSEMTPKIDQPIGCANCHEAGTMRLVITNPAVDAALNAEGIDWHTYTRQQMRSLVCANCHVTYFFAGQGQLLTVPWNDGTRVEDILKYENSANFSDWTYPNSGMGLIKSRHPDYELFTADSTHFKAGVACADCHMPYIRDGAMKYSSHDVMSPLLNPDVSCGQCHTDVNYALDRVATIQDEVAAARTDAENALIDALTAIQAAAADSSADPALLEQARQTYRQGEFMWDFVSTANSTGFHNPEEALRILRNATDLARQAQMLAAQAADDPSLLKTGVYESQHPSPTASP